MPNMTNRGKRAWWDAKATMNNMRNRQKPSLHRGEGFDGSSIWKKLNMPGIFGETVWVRLAAEHPKTTVLWQILALSIATAAAGTLIAKLIPEAAVNNAGNGVYIAGLVLILTIEAIYQWLLRTATLATEEGVTAYAGRDRPDIATKDVQRALEQNRDTNETTLRRSLEPIERVSLLAIGLVVHLIAQEVGGEDSVPDWAITLMLGLAGLLWQLKNQTHIAKLTNGERTEKILRLFGNKPLIIAFTLLPVISAGTLSVLYFPWGTISIFLLALPVLWYWKKVRQSFQ